MAIARIFFPAACVALALGARAVAQDLEVGEEGISRPGGVYLSLRVEDAAACSRACDADGLCLAWTFLRAGACELKAVAPNRVIEPGARSGLSPRAPDFARRIMRPIAPPSPPAAVAEAAPAPAPDPEAALLGGPPMAAPEALRPRLGAAGT